MSGNRLVDIEGEFRIESRSGLAYMVYFGKNDAQGKEVWVALPKSLVEFNDDDNIFTMPEWMALEKGLI